MNIEVGKKYRLRGVIENGFYTDENGERVTNYTKEDVVRFVRKITPERVICECGRQFLREGLTAEEFVDYSY